MQQILEGIYQQGVLILSHPLQRESEGKHFRLILLEDNDLLAAKIDFFQFVENHTFVLPEDTQLKREAWYE
jgi:transcriptional regulator of heat shock response